MSGTRGPTVRQRRLAAELRRLRENRKLTGDEVAERLAWSTAKVSRLENARTGARLEDVKRLLELYEVEGPRLAELVALAEDAAQRGWWEDYPALGAGYAGFIAFESDASVARQWESGVVPGLLQTEEYARHVVEGWNVVATLPPQEVQRWIEVRMRRQRVLDAARPLELDVVVDEAVLHRRVGDASVMADQIGHLRAMADRPHVSLRVLPLDGPHPIMAGSFTLLEFPPVHDVTFPDIVQTESLTFTYLEDERETHMYRLTHQRLTREAFDLELSAERLSAAAQVWRDRA